MGNNVSECDEGGRWLTVYVYTCFSAKLDHPFLHTPFRDSMNADRHRFESNQTDSLPTFIAGSSPRKHA